MNMAFLAFYRVMLIYPMLQLAEDTSQYTFSRKIELRYPDVASCDEMISNSRPTRSIFSTTSIDDYADRLQLHPSIPFSAYDLICWVRKFTSGGLRPISFRLYELFIYSTLSRFILCNTLFLILFTDYTNAVPRRVQEPWTVVLCKFKGNPAEPHSASWIKEWIDGAHPGSCFK